jgi:hypothetical protein
MRRSLLPNVFATIVFATFVATAPAGAECKTPPKAPEMPQGATATEDEMREGRQTLQAYVELLETFEKCMDGQIRNAPKGTNQEELVRWQLSSEAANDAAHIIADIYSEQLRAFKARQ